MSPTVLLATIRRRGCQLLVDGERLGLTPADRLTDDLRAQLREHKPAILAILATGVLPCPACREPLAAFECCWGCYGRLCQGCGGWMSQRPYAIHCGACLAERFARLEAERPRQQDSHSDNPRLYPCPSCASAGTIKLIPRL